MLARLLSLWKGFFARLRLYRLGCRHDVLSLRGDEVFCLKPARRSRRHLVQSSLEQGLSAREDCESAVTSCVATPNPGGLFNSAKNKTRYDLLCLRSDLVLFFLTSPAI